jgi:hypothetical protein
VLQNSFSQGDLKISAPWLSFAKFELGGCHHPGISLYDVLNGDIPEGADTLEPTGQDQGLQPVFHHALPNGSLGHFLF